MRESLSLSPPNKVNNYKKNVSNNMFCPAHAHGQTNTHAHTHTQERELSTLTGLECQKTTESYYQDLKTISSVINILKGK